MGKPKACIEGFERVWGPPQHGINCHNDVPNSGLATSKLCAMGQKKYFRSRARTKKTRAAAEDNVREVKFVKLLTLTLIIQFALFGLGQSLGFNFGAYLLGDKDRFNDLLFNLQTTASNIPFFLEGSPEGTQPSLYDVTNGFDYPYFKLLGVLGTNRTSSLFIMIILYSLLIFALNSIMKNYKITLLISLSYPVIFTFFRGNQVIFMATLLTIYLLLIKKNRFLSASVILSLITAHIFPFLIFGMILILYKKYAHFLCTCLLSLSIFLIPFFVMGTSFQRNLRILSQTSSQYINDYVIKDAGLLANNSLFGLLKSFLYLFHSGKVWSPQSRENEVLKLVSYYSFFLVLIGLFLFAIYSYKARTISIFRNPKSSISEIFLALTLILVLFPQVSADYKLIVLIIPLVSLFRENSSYLTKRNLILYLLLLLPKHFIYWQFDWAPTGVTLQSIVNPILGLFLLFSLTSYLGESVTRHSDQGSDKELG